MEKEKKPIFEEENGISSKAKKRIKRLWKKKEKVLKRNSDIYLIPSDFSSVSTDQYPVESTLQEVAKKLQLNFNKYSSLSFDFMKVAEDDSLRWYVSIASDYLNAARAKVVVSEVYAKMWVAFQRYPEKYILVLYAEQSRIHVGVGKGELLYYREFSTKVDSLDLAEMKSLVSTVISKFTELSYPAIEIEKSCIIEQISPDLLRAFPYPEVIEADGAYYNGKLNLNITKQHRKKVTWNNFSLVLPIAGRYVLSFIITFSLFFSFFFPANSVLNYAKGLFTQKNTVLEKNIEDIRAEKTKLYDVINQLKKEQEMVNSWEEASKKIQRLNIVDLIKVVNTPNVISINVTGNNITIQVRVNSTYEMDAYISRLINSGFFASLNAPERKAGSFDFVIQGVLKS